MLIKIAIGGNGYRIYENASNVTFITDVKLPEKIAEATTMTDLATALDTPESSELALDINDSSHIMAVIQDLFAGTNFVSDYFCHEHYYHKAILHHNFSQVKCSVLKFVENSEKQIEHNILSSFPILLCNDDGKVLETLAY